MIEIRGWDEFSTSDHKTKVEKCKIEFGFFFACIHNSSLIHNSLLRFILWEEQDPSDGLVRHLTKWEIFKLRKSEYTFPMQIKLVKRVE